MKRTSKRTGASRRSSPKSPPRARRRRAVPAAAEQVLADFAAVAARHELRWFLFGAQAVALYGVQRTSADVDVTLELGDLDPRALIRDLAEHGLPATIDDDAFVAATRVVPVIHRATAWPMDIVLAGPGIEDLFLDGARTMALGARRIPVIAPEHLVALKILAGRPKDIEDVRGLVRVPGLALDVRAADETLALLEGALDRSDLRPRLAELVKTRRRGSR